MPRIKSGNILLTVFKNTEEHMQDNINEILATKRAWRKGDVDRRINKEERRNAADSIRRGREIESHLKPSIQRSENRILILALGYIFVLIMMLACFMGKAHAYSFNQNVELNRNITIEGYSINTWAEAIHHAEGNDNYGILAHYKHTTYKQACINTIRHAHRLWIKEGRPDSFLYFLGKRYCPVGCSNDNGTNKFWIDNVRYWLWRLNQ